ncbi:MAG: hypothetical protein A3H45_13160 [Ignavibacteria bacterium RIFCSPLOWO2_02_FULL_55_14]|nr:MAG: hypothetical protein A3G43_06785 [Ignavibacteria bacterium RIFCSPLOWO2_12_FULL_56_21]OGU73019.1 MAG: hypothetical protein A3H45_13160 [Ignavibacteria bacterium RIFCSPLOWO2_02_FULL_55_14]
MRFKRFEDMPVWRAARKLASNIAEGYERETTSDFLRFLSYAKESAGELRSQLYVAFDIGYIKEEDFRDFSRSCISISIQLTRFMQYLEVSQP